jgi:hypothetical protein
MEINDSDDLYDDLKDLYHASMFDWDMAPESLKKDFHKITRESLDKILTYLENQKKNLSYRDGFG